MNNFRLYLYDKKHVKVCIIIFLKDDFNNKIYDLKELKKYYLEKFFFYIFLN